MCSIETSDNEKYDKNLEDLKIALKNRLILEWRLCTWLVDEQSELLCSKAYQKAHHIENNLRAFASKVLIHFLGVNWLECAGLDNYNLSVKDLKKAFVQRVPEFDDINTDFLLMTLETLVKIIFEGIVYEEELTITKEQYNQIQKMGLKESVKGVNIAEYIKKKRVIDKCIWEDLFIPYIDKPEDFKKSANRFILARNHVAHSKVLTDSAFKRILFDFDEFDEYIRLADEKYENEETSKEVLATWEVEEDFRQEQAEREADETAYYRERLSDETGMDILDETEIIDWFTEVIHDLYDDIYQYYHLDVGFELSDFSVLTEDTLTFSINCLAVEDGTAKVDIVTDYNIDSDLGGTSICTVVCRDSDGEELFKAEIRFHNGNGYENDEGLMEVDDSTEYDDLEIESFKNNLIVTIDKLNPYPAILAGLEYESKGGERYVADYPCDECGKYGVSVNEAFLPIGRCCYCGFENELAECIRCGELFSVCDLENELCPACAEYIEKQ